MWRFWTGPRGQVWADAGEGRVGINEALSDAITSLSPRGQPVSLSTYWIDRTLGRLRLPDSGEEIIVAGGNATYLYRRSQQVRAHAIYDTFDDEWMDVEEFERGLEAWKATIERSIRKGAAVSDDLSNYQRNPWPD